MGVLCRRIRSHAIHARRSTSPATEGTFALRKEVYGRHGSSEGVCRMKKFRRHGRERFCRLFGAVQTSAETDAGTSTGV